VQAGALEGERLLVMEDEAIIAFDLKRVLEREGASVRLSATVPKALQFADHAALSAGVLDVRVGTEDGKVVCEPLRRRSVPFIFFTGTMQKPFSRWPMSPVVQKPAAASTIVGALKFVLAAGIPTANGNDADETVARLDKTIFEGEERIERMRRCIRRLEARGFDTSAGVEVINTMTKVIDNKRAHQRMATSHARRRGPA
jgi:CheY-like chemotaxis protein